MHLPLFVVPCLYLRYILGKFGTPRLIVVQLIQAVYLLNRNTAQKNLVTKKSVYLTHFLFSYLYFCLFPVN